jgi:hypothetical protein
MAIFVASVKTAEEKAKTMNRPQDMCHSHDFNNQKSSIHGSTPPVCKRHASVGLVPAGQQLGSYAPPMVANCGDGFRCAGCPKEIILA